MNRREPQGHAPEVTLVHPRPSPSQPLRRSRRLHNEPPPSTALNCPGTSMTHQSVLHLTSLRGYVKKLAGASHRQTTPNTPNLSCPRRKTRRGSSDFSHLVGWASVQVNYSVGRPVRAEIKELVQNFACDSENNNDERTNRARAPAVPAQITAKQLSHSCRLGDRAGGRVNSLPFLNSSLTRKKNMPPMHSANTGHNFRALLSR